MELKKYKKKRITPQGWKEITLAEVFNTSSGATPLSTEASYYENGTIPWINSGELASPYIYDTTNFISQAGFENSSTEIYPIDTVLVAMYGATAGKASLLKMEACTNQAICAILPNKDYSSTFLKYSIDTLYDHLVGLSSGSARDNLSQAELKKLKLIMPPTKNEQNKLVSILASIDRKIELNQAINQNLEAMAKQLYDYWFVQFDFPNKDGKPYKSSGGEMVWNEKLKRMIPKEWTNANIYQLASISKETVNPQAQPNELFKHYSLPEYDKTGTYAEEYGIDIQSAKFIVTNNCILVSKLNPWTSRVICGNRGSNQICSTEFVVWNPASLKTKGFLFMLAKSAKFIEYCTQGATGTSHSHRRINPELIGKLVTFTGIIVLVLLVAIFGFLFWEPKPEYIQGEAEATEVRISGKVPGLIEIFRFNE